MSIAEFPYLVVLLSLCLAPCACHVRRAVEIRKMAESNHIFTEHLLWTSVCQSEISCGASCLNDPTCVRFTVSKHTEGKVECRGHSGQGTGAGHWSPGAVLYELQTRNSVSSLTTQQKPLTTTSEPDTTTIHESDQDVTISTTLDHGRGGDVVATPAGGVSASWTAADHSGNRVDQDNGNHDDVTRAGGGLDNTKGSTLSYSKCDDDQQCQARWSNSECDDGICECIEGYFYYSVTGECVKNQGSTLPYSQCDNDQQCMRSNSQCANGMCECTQGYWYNIFDGECVESHDSSSADLQDMFLANDGFMTEGYFLSEAGTFNKFNMYISPSDCLYFCLKSYVGCPSVDCFS